MTWIGTLSTLSGSTKTIVEFILKMHDAESARRHIAAILYLEIEQNIDLLGRLRLDGPNALPSTDILLAGASTALRVDAHAAAMVLADWVERDASQANDPATVFRWPGLMTSSRIRAILEDDENEVESEYQRLQSLGFVSSRVRTLQDLAVLSQEAASVLKQVRYGVRLRNIREHELALRQWLRDDRRMDHVTWPAYG